MALTITLAEGDDFYIVKQGEPDARFVMTEMFQDEAFTLQTPEGREIEIGPEKATEIYEGVKVSEGHRMLSSKVRVVFQAPPEVRIYRGELYREMGRA